MTREELLELIPAYALDALDSDERMMVEELLAIDTEAQNLLAEYSTLSNMLPFAVPVRAAPSHLKNNLRQHLKKRDTKAAISQSATVEMLEPLQKNPASQYHLFISSAAALIVMLIGIVFYISQNTEPEPRRVPRGLILYNEISEQANPQRFAVTPTGAENATGELLVSEDGLQAVLLIAELPTIDEDERYQLWIAQEESVESGGLFYWATGHGPYYIIIPLDSHISEYTRFGMSVEPENGSPNPNAPSGTPLFSVTIAQAG